MFEALKDLFFPARCPFCDRAGCTGCIQREKLLNNRVCPLCGSAGCHCRGSFCDGYFVLFAYDKEVQSSILRMKYGGRPSYSIGYARALAGLLGEREHPVFDLIAHVPFCAEEKRSRDYNASKLLAQNLARASGIRHAPRALRKLRRTEKQHLLSAQQRRENLRGCFSASPKVAGKIVLLCDDVITTGATVNECARALKQAGAKEVYAASVAASVLIHSPKH